MSAPLSPLAQALVIRADRDAAASPLNGAAIAALRGRTLLEVYSEHPAIRARENEMLARIMALDVAAMPPPTDLVAVLLEALSQRLGGPGHAAAWRSIGINPSRGRDLLARNARAVDWPVWKTLRDAALMADDD